ncbi:ABC transporter permease [Trueperella sp. LYQ141]|uniref:ABC transporter permease n=1 Tax=Trueperella sp. LYQ141 TaxID=3391058 RepID=UPI0039834519
MLRLIIQREMRALAATKSFIISTVVFALLILGGGFLGQFLLHKDSDDNSSQAPQSVTEQPVIFVEKQMEPLTPYLEQAINGAHITLTPIAENGSEKAIIEWSKKSGSDAIGLSGTLDQPVIVHESSLSSNNKLTPYVELGAVARLMADKGATVSAQNYQDLAYQINIPEREVVLPSTNLMAANPVGYFVGMAGGMILIYSIILGMNTVALGIVEEKSSRIVEILLSTVRSRTLLLGKILGIGIVVLSQVTLLVLCAVAALNIAGVWTQISISGYLIEIIIWVILGFFCYASITAALASLVSRAEEVSSAVSPVTLFLFVPFYLALYFVPNSPDSIWTKGMSFIPGFAPFIMANRSAYGISTTTEVIISMAISVVAIFLLAAFAGRVYSHSVLHMGKRMSLRKALFSPKAAPKEVPTVAGTSVLNGQVGQVKTEFHERTSTS